MYKRQVSDDITPNIYTAFQQVAAGEKVSLKDMILERSGLPLLPASIELAGAELELVSIYGREQLLKNMLKPLTKKYDFIFIDCPPAISMLTVNALVASNYVVMPLQAEFLPLKGVRSFMKHFDTIKKTLNKKLEILGIVFTRFDPRKTMTKEIINELEKDFPNLIFDTTIRTNVKLVEAQAAGQDIYTFDRTSNGAQDYLQLAEELLKKLSND